MHNVDGKGRRQRRKAKMGAKVEGKGRCRKLRQKSKAEGEGIDRRIK